MQSFWLYLLVMGVFDLLGWFFEVFLCWIAGAAITTCVAVMVACAVAIFLLAVFGVWFQTAHHQLPESIALNLNRHMF